MINELHQIIIAEAAKAFGVGKVAAMQLESYSQIAMKAIVQMGTIRKSLIPAIQKAIDDCQTDLVPGSPEQQEAIRQCLDISQTLITLFAPLRNQAVAACDILEEKIEKHLRYCQANLDKIDSETTNGLIAPKENARYDLVD